MSKRVFEVVAPDNRVLRRQATGDSNWNYCVFYKTTVGYDQNEREVWEVASWKTTQELAEREYRSYAKHRGADAVALVEARQVA